MKIVIEVNEETQQVGMTCDKSVRIDDLMTVFFTLQLSVLKQATPSEDDPHFEQIRDLLYDNYNNGASHVLSLYAPDNTLRPDLTEEAMLRSEDAYMKQWWISIIKNPS